MFDLSKLDIKLFPNYFSLNINNSTYPEEEEGEKEILLITEETLPQGIIEENEIFAIFPKNKDYICTLDKKNFLNFFQYMFDLYPKFYTPRKPVLIDKEKSYSLVLEFGKPYITNFLTENKKRIVIIQGITVKRKVYLIHEKEEEINIDSIFRKIPKNNIVTTNELYERVKKKNEFMIIEGYDNLDYQKKLRERMFYKNL